VSLPIREHFEPRFMKYSATYTSLSIEEREKFLNDLRTRLKWTHMMVNFVSGFDPADFSEPIYGNPLSIPEINRFLEINNLGFQIPLDWKH